MVLQNLRWRIKDTDEEEKQIQKSIMKLEKDIFQMNFQINQYEVGASFKEGIKSLIKNKAKSSDHLNLRAFKIK